MKRKWKKKEMNKNGKLKEKVQWKNHFWMWNY